MKKVYINPEMQVIGIQQQAIICSSITNIGGNGDIGIGGGGSNDIGGDGARNRELDEFFITDEDEL